MSNKGHSFDYPVKFTFIHYSGSILKEFDTAMKDVLDERFKIFQICKTVHFIVVELKFL